MREEFSVELAATWSAAHRDEELEREDDVWFAAVELFASPEVSALWEKWGDACSSIRHVVSEAKKFDTEVLRSIAPAINLQQDIRAALTKQMRKELEGWAG